jgi:hypothetical protein
MSPNIFGLSMSSKPATPNHYVWKKKRACLLIPIDPSSSNKGLWSDPILVIADSVHMGNIASQDGETNTRSSTERIGSNWLLVHVKRAPARFSSLSAIAAIASLNLRILGQFTTSLLLSCSRLMRLKSPPPPMVGGSW